MSQNPFDPEFIKRQMEAAATIEREPIGAIERRVWRFEDETSFGDPPLGVVNRRKAIDRGKKSGAPKRRWRREMK